MNFFIIFFVKWFLFVVVGILIESSVTKSTNIKQRYGTDDFSESVSDKTDKIIPYSLIYLFKEIVSTNPPNNDLVDTFAKVQVRPESKHFQIISDLKTLPIDQFDHFKAYPLGTSTTDIDKIMQKINDTIFLHNGYKDHDYYLGELRSILFLYRVPHGMLHA